MQIKLEKDCKPVAWQKEAHHDEYPITTNDLDPQGKSHHST